MDNKTFWLWFISCSMYATTLPTKFDWRTEVGGLNPVRHQGSCGSDWAITQTDNIEIALKIFEGDDTLLSPQYLMACNSEKHGCNGGFFSEKFLTTEGLIEEKYFPYQAKDVSCPNMQDKTYVKAKKLVFISNGPDNKPPVDQIKSAIYNHGAVMATIYSDSNFTAYRGGVYNNCNSQSINHLVNIVGWNDKGGYWIARNTWGDSWGEKGYFRIKYGCNNIAETAAYYELE